MERLIRITILLVMTMTLVFAFSACKQSSDNTQNDNIHSDDTTSDNTEDSLPPVEDSGEIELPNDEVCQHTSLNPVKENLKSATCTEYGSYDVVNYCNDCGEKISWETVPIFSTGHSYDLVIIENEVDPTCKTQGSYDEVTYCSVCHEVGSRNTVLLPLSDHSYSTPVRENVVDSTCRTQGSYDEVTYCSACNEIISFKTVTLPMADHYCSSPITENLTATCKEDGTVEYVEYCDVCNIELNRTMQIVKSSGHVWQNNVCAVCSTAYSVAECLELKLSEDGTYYIITGIGTFTGELLEIPSIYNNKIVSEIADYAFANCTFITKAIIPYTITKIGCGAAYGCTGLQEIQFKNVRGWHLLSKSDPNFDISVDDEIKKVLASNNISADMIDSPLFAGIITNMANKEINDRYIKLLIENMDYYLEK